MREFEPHSLRKTKKLNYMAILKILGSGSSGNGYVIECSDESLIIELGLPYKNYIMSTPMSNVAGALVSHTHGDHLVKNTAAKMLKMCIPVYGNKSVTEAVKNIDVVNCSRELKLHSMTVVGKGFKVQPIKLSHSVENFGFVIDHREFGRLVFATDTSAFNLKIKNVNHWMIECNYDPNIVVDTKLSGNEVRSNYSDHLSKQKCIDVLLNNYDKDITKSITLIHLSDSNSNAVAFREETINTLGFDNVHVCDDLVKNQVINL